MVPWRRIRALLAVLALLVIVPAQGALGASGPTPTPTPGDGGVSPLVFNGSPSGIGLYLGESDQGTSFSPALVRIDSTYDTIIHVANATASSTSVTVTFYDGSGNLKGTTASGPLAGWASWTDDVQVDPSVGVDFIGSAKITAASPIAVSVDVLNSASPENLDSYQEVPGNSTVFNGSTNVGYVPLLPSWTGIVSPNLYLHNTGLSPATVNLKFYCTNPGNSSNSCSSMVPDPITVSPYGEYDVSVNQVTGIKYLNFDAATQIQSDQPLAVAADDTAPSTFWAAAPSSSDAGTTFYLPRFEYNARLISGSDWVTGIVLLNTSSSSQTFTVSVYRPDGQLALQMQLPDVSPMAVGKFDYGGVNTSLALPNGFIGSVVVTSQASAVGWTGQYNYSPNATSFTAGASLILPSAAPTGSAVIVPAVRKNAVEITRAPSSVASTGITIQNPSASSNTYQITFYDVNGNLVYTRTVVMPPRAMWYLSQATDTNLPSGFVGSARIVNLAGGALPIVDVEVDAGSFQLPPTLSLPQFHVYLPVTFR